MLARALGELPSRQLKSARAGQDQQTRDSAMQDDNHTANSSINREPLTHSLLRSSNLHSSVLSSSSSRPNAARSSTHDEMDAGDIILRLRSAVDKVQLCVKYCVYLGSSTFHV